MSEPGGIAVLADSKAQNLYLADIVSLAGFKLVLPEDASLIVISASRAALPQGKTVLRLDGHDIALPAGESVVKTPLKAADLILTLRKKIAVQNALPKFIPLKGGTLDTQENIWAAPLGSIVRLTEKETSILTCLYLAGESGVSREALLSKVWSYAETVETHTLETHIYRLRQKIETDPSKPDILITTGDGYILQKAD